MSMASEHQRFASLVQNQLHLPSVLEELEELSVCSVEDVWSILPDPHKTLVTQAYLELVLRGSGLELSAALREGGLLDVNSFTVHLLKNVEQLSLSQLVRLVQDGLLEFRELLTKEGVEHISSLQPDWGASPVEDLFCWSVSGAYPSGRSSSTELARQLATSLLLSLSKSPHSKSVIDRVKQRISLDPLDDLCTQLLVDKLTEDFPESFHSVLECQEKWHYSCLSESNRQFFSMLVRASERLFSALGPTLACMTDIHWSNLLSFTVSLLNCSPQALNQFKGRADGLRDMMDKALSEELDVLFHSSLLMARQAALEGGHIFSSYEKWFKELCGMVTGKRQVQFLLKWLTKLVPHEPVYALRAHLTLSSSTLGVKNKRIVSEYTDLVRVRLSELKEPVRPSHSEMQSASEDLRKALSKFEETGQIPKFLLQKKTFNPPYYQERFLRCLLSPSNHGNSKIENLIGALERKNMIPENLLHAFRLSSSTDTVESEVVKLIDDWIESECLSHLSKLSAHLSLSPHITTAHIEFVDSLLNKVCQILSESTAPLWLAPLLGMLSRHTVYCKVLVVRMQELLCERPHTLTKLQLCGLGTLCAFLWTSDSQLGDAHLSLSTRQASSLRDLAEELYATLPVWSCDLTVAEATRLFATHCLQCVESVCGERPVSLHRKWVYVEHRVEFSEIRPEESSHKVELCFPDWARWEVERGDRDYLSPTTRYLYAREQLTQFLLKASDQGKETLCVEMFVTLCQLPPTTHGLTILMMLTADVSTPWLWRAVNVTLERLPDDDSVFNKVVNLVCSLPSHLLADSHSPNLIVDSLKLLMSRTSSFVLPLALMMHLSANGGVYPELVASSLVFQASILCHAPCLQSLPSVLSSKVDWLHKGALFPMNFDPILAGVCLFNQFNSGRVTLQCVKKKLCSMENSSKNNLCVVMMECCVQRFARCNSEPSLDIKTLITLLLDVYPASILVCSDQSHHQLVQTMRREFLISISASYPHLLFQVLCGVSRDAFNLKLTTQDCPLILSLILSSHKTLMESSLEETLELLSGATQLAKVCIQASSRDVVRACSTKCHYSLKHLL